MVLDRKSVALAIGWALLIPLLYSGPSGHPGRMLAAVVLCSLLGPTALLLFARGSRLDRLAAALERRVPLVLGLAIATFVGITVFGAFSKLHAFSPRLGQVGLYTQSLWTALHGHPFSNTHETLDGSLASHFGVHFSPALIPVLAVFAIWPSPLMLLTLQALVLGLTAVPFFALVRRRAGGAGALGLTIAFLLLPVLWSTARDFHDKAFLPLLFLTALWALESRRRWLFFLAVVGALGWREDAGLTLVGIAVYAVLLRREWRVAMGGAALGLVWFVVVTNWVMPAFASPGLWMNPQRFVALHLGPWGPTPRDALAGLAGHPLAFLQDLSSGGRLRYLFVLLRPALILPLIADPAWIMGLPDLAVNTFSHYDAMRGSGYHALVPQVSGLLAAALAAGRLAIRQPAPRRPAAGLAIGLVVLAGVIPALVEELPRPDPPRLPQAPARAVLRDLPPDVPVYVPIGLFPHVARRLNVGCWEALHERSWEDSLRGRYAWVVLWPAGDHGTPRRDSVLDARLAADTRFERLDRYFPLRVYRRRPLPP